MSQGVLQYTLGLGTAQFTKAISGAEGKIKGLTSSLVALTGVGAAMAGGFAGLRGMANIIEGTLSAVERGAALEHLSRTTGESAGNLALLQSGLKAVGIDAASAGPMLLMMQRSLGGINDEGEPTAHIFAQLGLNIEDLKRMSAPAVISALADSISKLDNARATAAAAKIFGRGGAQQFLELARSGREFNKALAENGQRALLLARTAPMFEALARAIEKVKSKSKDFYLGFAQYAAPPILKLLERIENIDLTKAGQALGRLTGLLSESFHGSGEILLAAIEVALQRAEFYAAKFASTLAAAVAEGLVAALPLALSAGLEAMGASLSAVWSGAANLDAIGWKKEIDRLAKLRQEHPEQWNDDNALQLKNAQRYFSDSDATARAGAEKIETARKESMSNIARAIGEGMRASLSAGANEWRTFGTPPETAESQKLQRALAHYAEVSERFAGLFGTGEGSARLPGAGLAYQMVASNIQKMGFVMRASSASDPAGQTARNTARTAHLLERLISVTRPVSLNLAVSNTLPY